MERIDCTDVYSNRMLCLFLTESRQKYPTLRVLPCAVGTCGWNLPALTFLAP